MAKRPAGDDYDGWVALLGVSQRRQAARRHLMAVGNPALPSLRRGLRHPEPAVRRVCASILDHFVDDASLPDLVAALDDPDADVCARALHALACDRCKENECRPGDDLFVPKALEMARSHPDPNLRASAMDTIGQVATRRADLVRELADIAEREPNPGLRTLALRLTAKARRAWATTVDGEPASHSVSDGGWA